MDQSNDSFGGTVYRRRRRSGPLAWLVRAVFYVSSLAPAAWIVWHYDLINRMDRRLKGEAAPAAERVVERPAAPVVAPVERAPVKPRDSERQAASSQEAVVDKAPRTPSVLPREESPTTAVVESAAADEPVIAHTIDLDLGGRRQRFALEGTAEKQYRVVTVAGCPAAYKIDPESGSFGARDAATIVIAGRREVRLRVTVEEGVRGPAIVVEPMVRSDDGKEIPFILANMQKIRQRIVKQGNDAADELAGIEAEGSRLMAWINAPVAKPLAEVGHAKSRVVALEAARVRQAATIESLEADLAVAQSLEKLGRQLHAKCKLGIARVE